MNTNNTYLKDSFDSVNYQAHRLSYPQGLYEAVMCFHQGATETALDVGCGTGIATFPLLNYFDKVIGCDPSASMLLSAENERRHLAQGSQQRIEFKQTGAENLTDLIPEESVDMLIAAESLHWVNHRAFFEEAFKVLKPEGTLAYWFYVEPVFLDYPRANEIFQRLVYEDESYLAPYWPPEMHHVRSFGTSIVIPENKFNHVERKIHNPLRPEGSTAFKMVRNSYTLENLQNLVSTWSVCHTWKEQNGKSGKDFAEVLVESLARECGWDRGTLLRVEWGTAYYMARKRAIPYAVPDVDTFQESK